MHTNITVTVNQATTAITKIIRAGLVPFLHGSPGCGKSQIIHTLAETFNLKLIDVRLSQCDPTDLNGYPQIIGGKASYIPMDTFPLEGDSVPEGYSGWLLFFDETNSAAAAVQSAAYKILLDRKIGQKKLHKNVAMACAGNLATDNAIVEEMSTALQSRLIHLELAISSDEWVKWAIAKGFDHRITSFIQFKPSNLFTFQPDHSDKTYSCPRTLEFANKIVKISDDVNEDLLPILAGTLSEGVAREMLIFFKIYKELPNISAVELDPLNIPMSTEPSVLFAMCGALANNMSNTNAVNLLKYIKRMPVEFQVICLHEALRRNKTLITHTALQEWIASTSTEIF
jgi:hypothetical protein